MNYPAEKNTPTKWHKLKIVKILNSVCLFFFLIPILRKTKTKLYIFLTISMCITNILGTAYVIYVKQAFSFAPVLPTHKYTDLAIQLSFAITNTLAFCKTFTHKTLFFRMNKLIVVLDDEIGVFTANRNIYSDEPLIITFVIVQSSVCIYILFDCFAVFRFDLIVILIFDHLNLFLIALSLLQIIFYVSYVHAVWKLVNAELLKHVRDDSNLTFLIRKIENLIDLVGYINQYFGSQIFFIIVDMELFIIFTINTYIKMYMEFINGIAMIHITTCLCDIVICVSIKLKIYTNLHIFFLFVDC